MKSIIPAELRPDQVMAILDTREQLPLDLHPLRVEVAGLDTGDYWLKGLEHLVAVERKGLSDLLACIGSERERFDRRFNAYSAIRFVPDCRIHMGRSGGGRVAVEGYGRRRHRVATRSVAIGIPVIMAGVHERAGRYVSRLLFTAARRRGGTAHAGRRRRHTARPRSRTRQSAIGTARRSTARPAAVGIVVGCRWTTGQLLPATRGIGQGSGNRAKRNVNQRQGRRDSAPFVLGSVQRTL